MTVPKVRAEATSKPLRGSSGPQSKKTKGFLVALGASAGGLKALKQLLGGLGANFPAPIVAVLHMDPSHQSHIVPLLQRETRLTVREAKSGQRLVRGCVYVAPPDRHLEVRGDVIELTRAARVRFSRPSIDQLFASVASSFGDRAVAVILSGTGSDGSGGASIIKGAGGMVIVQDPANAEFAGMPESALATGSVDVQLPIKGIPRLLMRAVRPGRPGELPPEWPRVVALLHDRFGTDFSRYRPTTLQRRLERRVLASQEPSLKAYLTRLQRDPSEQERLHADFLIKVSGFFRDPTEWKRLDARVLRPLALSSPTALRAWSAGCATGEEAYSTAILFAEALEGTSRRRQFTVFATDLDESALAFARAGRYTNAQLAGVSARRRKKYFDADGGGWRVKKELRRHVIFGKHDLLRDPPLASIDLVLCRNVLIYLTPAEGRAVLVRLTYSLNQGGVLFVGRSESLHSRDTGLERVGESGRLFRRRVGKPAAPERPRFADRPVPTFARGPARKPTFTATVTSEDPGFRRLLLESSTVVMFGTDSTGRVVLWNRAAANFFDVSSAEALGKPISESVGADFWSDLKGSVDEERTGHRATRAAQRVFRGRGDARRSLDIEWLPLEGLHGAPAGLLFVAVDATARSRLDPSGVGGVARREAGVAAEELASANQELETLNEELQSTSEEQQTLNEELESRNEELATVNEELQSLNEELNTLNEEVGVRIAESEKLSAFLRTILDLAPEAVIVCDAKNRITFWNSVASKLFHVSEKQAIGTDLFELVPALDVRTVRAMVARGAKSTTAVVRGLVRPGAFHVRVGVVRDQQDRRRGYALRISTSSQERVSNGPD